MGGGEFPARSARGEEGSARGEEGSAGGRREANDIVGGVMGGMRGSGPY